VVSVSLLLALDQHRSNAATSSQSRCPCKLGLHQVVVSPQEPLPHINLLALPTPSCSWHRFNVKRRVARLPPLTEQEFEALINQEGSDVGVLGLQLPQVHSHHIMTLNLFACGF
jgi:hypothetical protein